MDIKDPLYQLELEKFEIQQKIDLVKKVKQLKAEENRRNPIIISDDPGPVKAEATPLPIASQPATSGIDQYNSGPMTPIAPRSGSAVSDAATTSSLLVATSSSAPISLHGLSLSGSRISLNCIDQGITTPSLIYSTCHNIETRNLYHESESPFSGNEHGQYSGRHQKQRLSTIWNKSNDKGGRGKARNYQEQLSSTITVSEKGAATINSRLRCP